MLNGKSRVRANRDEAEKEYQAALAMNPFDPKSECGLGELAVRRTDLKSAYAHYRRAVELQPDDAKANRGLASALILLNQPEKARPFLERVAQLDPTDGATHYRLATLYRDSGRAADAARELAEFRRFKDMKERLAQIYKDMRPEPGKRERRDPDVPQ